MDQSYLLLTTLLNAWTYDENNARFTVDNSSALNGYVGWIGVYVIKANLIRAIDRIPSTPDTDRMLAGHIGATHFQPQPLTLA